MSDEEIPDEDDDGSTPAEQPTVSAANTTTHRRQQTAAIIEREKVRNFWSNVLRDEVGARVIWSMLRDLHTFEDERFGAGPNGFPAPEASLHARGQRDFGLRWYRTLALHDREALFALHDKFDPLFSKPKPPRRKQVE